MRVTRSVDRFGTRNKIGHGERNLLVKIQKVSTFLYHDSERGTIVPVSQITGQIAFPGNPEWHYMNIKLTQSKFDA